MPLPTTPDQRRHLLSVAGERNQAAQVSPACAQGDFAGAVMNVSPEAPYIERTMSAWPFCRLMVKRMAPTPSAPSALCNLMRRRWSSGTRRHQNLQPQSCGALSRYFRSIFSLRVPGQTHVTAASPHHPPSCGSGGAASTMQSISISALPFLRWNCLPWQERRFNPDDPLPRSPFAFSPAECGACDPSFNRAQKSNATCQSYSWSSSLRSSGIHLESAPKSP